MYKILFVLIFITSLFTQETDTSYKEVARSFIKCIQMNDIEQLSERLFYPYKRPDPIPPIKDKTEFKKRYTELFDDSLISIITHSDAETDWKDMGWRGIMLHDGIVWLDYDGKVIGINYRTLAEKEVLKKWIEYERSLLHSSLKEYLKPMYTLITKRFIVRIDLLENGTYRYASWKKSATLLDKPDLVLFNGELSAEGSGGNHQFNFKNGIYTYSIYVNAIRSEESAPFYLEVSKGKKILLNEAATKRPLQYEH